MRIHYQLIVGIASLILSLSDHHPAEAPQATQTMTVHVPDRISIQAPSPEVTQTVSPDSDKLRFPDQLWVVGSNVTAGVHVSFTTEGPFRLTSDPSVQRDAQLQIRVAHVSNHSTWEITNPIGETDYHVGKYRAAVHVESRTPGQADIGVTIKLLPGDGELLPHGEFVATVVGTICEN